jgi:hypothetical protein
MRLPRALSLATVACGALLACACSTSNTEADGGSPPVDAASGPQPVGAPCDPALATPCLPSDGCLVIACDPVLLVCTESIADAGPTCNGGAAPCTTSSDCDVGLTCGFPIGAGCSATGACLNPPLLCEDDAAACVTSGTVCGCSGAPVALVIQGFAAGPTPSPPGSCSTDAGDAGAPPVDAGGDGAVDP